MVAAALTEEWFEDLPFTYNSVLACIPEELRSVITVEWQDRDDIWTFR